MVIKRTAEAVSLGHPDKTADFISSYILDRYIEKDPCTKYAVEVLVKDNTVVLGGEVSSVISFTQEELYSFVLSALSEIGYTVSYSEIWKDFAINPSKIKLINLIGQQSHEINSGVVNDGWGDQGVFVGYASSGEEHLSREQSYAKKLCVALYNKALNSKNLGLDIKTQITINNDNTIDTAIVAIPMIKEEDLTQFIIEVLGSKPNNIIVNGTGSYTLHSSIADCGVTGRKLACDFYSARCAQGGGSPWTKDATKADLSLNLYARKLALQYLKDNDECFVYLSSCIGRKDLPSSLVKTLKDNKKEFFKIDVDKSPSEIIEELGLNKPIFADMCKRSIGGFMI